MFCGELLRWDLPPGEKRHHNRKRDSIPNPQIEHLKGNEFAVEWQRINVEWEEISGFDQPGIVEQAARLFCLSR